MQMPPRAPRDAHAAAAPDAATVLAAEGARARVSRWRRERANRAKGGAPKFGRLAETDRRGVEASPLRRRRRRWWRGRISTSAAAAVTAPRASSCKKLVWGWIFRATARRVFSSGVGLTSVCNSFFLLSCRPTAFSGGRGLQTGQSVT